MKGLCNIKDGRIKKINKYLEDINVYINNELYLEAAESANDLQTELLNLVSTDLRIRKIK